MKTTEDSYFVDTGKKRFVIGRKKFFFAPENGDSIELAFRNAEGKLFSAANGVLDSATLTACGKLRTSLRLEGWFGSENKEKSCRQAGFF